MEAQAAEFIEQLKISLDNSTFVKVSLGNYKGTEENLKNIYIRRIRIRQEEKLSFTFRFRTRDMVKNYTPEEGISLAMDYLNQGFRAATLFTTASDLIYDHSGKGKATLRRNPPTYTSVPDPDHDRAKKRLISNAKPYLTLLKVTDAEGKVLPSAQDKYKQINRYTEILSTLLASLPARDCLNVADMGSGKGYLTFALYDYLTREMNRKAKVTGVEMRPDMVNLCNSIATESGFDALNFVEGTIAEYDSTGTNVLIALHACDTSTDDALAKGIACGADLIVVAPCCHKQIRREMEKASENRELGFLMRHGIFMERQAEMLTDGIRALILEYFGYKTKVFEFISDAHTPKNVMIVGIRKRKSGKGSEDEMLKIREAKAFFGIKTHYLETLTGL
jgi:SAM-dependent methyltransferase